MRCIGWTRRGSERRSFVRGLLLSIVRAHKRLNAETRGKICELVHLL